MVREHLEPIGGALVDADAVGHARVLERVADLVSGVDQRRDLHTRRQCHQHGTRRRGSAHSPARRRRPHPHGGHRDRGDQHHGQALHGSAPLARRAESCHRCGSMRSSACAGFDPSGWEALARLPWVTICTACGTENTPDARFCSACGAPLATLCPECGAPLPADARFCPACGASVAGPGVVPSNERKLVTVLFADVTGSTTLGEQLDPEDLRAVFDTYFSAMREEIVAEGGTVEKFIGDAVMAAFGVPAAHEDDPSRAMRAALRMLRRLDEVNEELAAQHGVTLAIRIGVNTGEVLATTEPAPGEAMVTGDVVNAAARLTVAAEPGTVVAGERTRARCPRLPVRGPGPRELKGKADPGRGRRLGGDDRRRSNEVCRGCVRRWSGAMPSSILRSAFRAVGGRSKAAPRHDLRRRGRREEPADRTSSSQWSEGLPDPPLVFAGAACRTVTASRTGRWRRSSKGHAGSPRHRSAAARRGEGPGDRPELLTADVAADPVRATAALAYTVGLEDPDYAVRGVPTRARCETSSTRRGDRSSRPSRRPRR